MLRRITFFAGLLISLSACTNAPSPQNTTPSNPAQCAALRAQLLRAPMNANNNMPSAVADSQNANIQKLYHDQCE